MKAKTFSSPFGRPLDYLWSTGASTDQADRVFEILASGDLSLHNLTLVTKSTDPGGAILNRGVLLVDNVTIKTKTSNMEVVLNEGDLIIEQLLRLEKME